VKRILWVGDAACDSGFAKATHKTLEAFVAAGWHVVVWGSTTAAIRTTIPYKIYPAYVPGG
jgi:hypothetical protein